MENKGEMHLVKKKRTLTEQADMPTPPPCLQSLQIHTARLGPGCARDSAGKGPGPPPPSRQGICMLALKLSVLSTQKGGVGPRVW